MAGEEQLLGIRTEVRRHPERWGWAVFALAAGTFGNSLFVSRECWALRESAERWQKDVLDRDIDAALQRTEGWTDPEQVLATVDGITRLPTSWDPRQFEAL